MPVDGETRDYTWDDILCLILRDMGLDPLDRQHHQLWYIGDWVLPKHQKETLIRVTKYKMTYTERLKEHTRDKM